MTEEEKEQISKEERKKLVMTNGVVDMALEMETLDKRMGDVIEDEIDLSELMLVMRAKVKQLEGQRDEIRAEFWKAIRADEKAWFRKMREAGLKVMYKRVKNAELDGTSQVELHACDANDEAFTAIKRIFRKEEGPDEE